MNNFDQAIFVSWEGSIRIWRDSDANLRGTRNYVGCRLPHIEEGQGRFIPSDREGDAGKYYSGPAFAETARATS